MQLSLFKNNKNSKRYKKRKYTKRKREYWNSKKVVCDPPPELIQRLIKVKELYDRYGTLQHVASDLKITRERVRQLLIKGQQYRLYKYELTREKKLNELTNNISKDSLIEEIKNGTNRFDMCLKFSINMTSYFSLIKYYQIDTQDYVADVRKRKYLVRYSNMVDTLGHHPSTTEMQSRRNWRVSYNAIQRIWGSIDKFRNEFGIERPPYAIHPNTSQAWYKLIERHKQIKKGKVERVKVFIKKNGPVDIKTVSLELGYRIGATTSYLKELLKNNEVERIVDESLHKYLYK